MYLLVFLLGYGGSIVTIAINLVCVCVCLDMYVCVCVQYMCVYVTQIFVYEQTPSIKKCLLFNMKVCRHVHWVVKLCPFAFSDDMHSNEWAWVNVKILKWQSLIRMADSLHIQCL